MSATEYRPKESAEATTAALELRDLDVAYRVRGVDRQVLRGVSLRVERRERRPRRRVRLRQVDGCARDRALPATQRQGAIRLGARRRPRRLGLSGRELRELRSGSVSMVYQNPGRP